MADLNCIPEFVDEQFFIRMLIDTAKLVAKDFLWLKGTLSVKINLKHKGILEILNSTLFPKIQYTLKGFILRIPTIQIHNWYQAQSNFHNPFILDFLDQCRNEFGLMAGRNHEAFQLIRMMEQLSHRELQSLAIPCEYEQTVRFGHTKDLDSLLNELEGGKAGEEKKRRGIGRMGRIGGEGNCEEVDLELFGRKMN